MSLGHAIAPLLLIGSRAVINVSPADLRAIRTRDAARADPLTLQHILSAVAPEQRVRQYHISHGGFTEPEARQLHGEIGEEQHAPFSCWGRGQGG